MNTFIKPFLRVVVIFIIGTGWAITGYTYHFFELMVIGIVLVGVGMGVSLVNAFSVWFLDKNTTDEDWRKKYGTQN